MTAIQPAKKLHIVAVLDGRPGHEKQTLGILFALQKSCPTEIITFKVGRFSLLEEGVQTCRLFLPGTACEVPDWGGGKVDLVIGTGSRTHLPMLSCKKKYATPAVTCMLPPLYLRHRFDLCLVPEHDGVPAGNNILPTVGAPNLSINKGKHQDGRGLILLGGVDAKSHHWDSRQVAAMVEEIVSSEADKIWTVSSSPRTPQETAALITALLPRYGNIRFFDYKDTPAGWIEEQYDISSNVWVTADSISMIYEAISAGCRVGIMPMQWRRKTGKFSRNERLLVERRLVTPFAAWQQDKITIAGPGELNEAQRCAEWILQRWWPENLQ